MLTTPEFCVGNSKAYESLRIKLEQGRLIILERYDLRDKNVKIPDSLSGRGRISLGPLEPVLFFVGFDNKSLYIVQGDKVAHITQPGPAKYTSSRLSLTYYERLKIGSSGPTFHNIAGVTRYKDSVSSRRLLESVHEKITKPSRFNDYISFIVGRDV